MSRAYINIVEDLVKEIGILAADKTVDKLTEKDWTVVQDNILSIESHMKDLIHLYDLLDMRKQSNYYHPEDNLIHQSMLMTAEEVTR
tara:strand:+ start:857 stop:1117 length:261 start_codon:yes stop_codon:yes gene_type:complete